MSKEDRIAKLESGLRNINTCIAIIANNEAVKESKELPKMLTNLEKYIQKLLKGD